MTFTRKNCLLYAVTDRSWLGGRTLEEQVEDALKGGITMLQLREKDLPEDEFEQEALRVQQLCRAYNVPFIINDNVALAAKIGADGVHVGQGDMDPAEVRRILGPDAIIGVTAKTVEQAQAAEAAGADYLGSGAVFGSATKTDAIPMTLDRFREICACVSIPVVAIGGVGPQNIRQLAGRGMSGFAIVSGIFAAEDITGRCRELRSTAEELCPAVSAETVMELCGTVRSLRPVVQCITNIVTVNDCANALLAVGASPTMAHHPDEAADLAAFTDALVCNMGATENITAMNQSGKYTRERSHPIVLDPVGCAGSAWRRQQCLDLIEAVHPACIRGNAAEITALALGCDTGRGVDAPASGQFGGDSIADYALALSARTGAIVVASGAVDCIAYDGQYSEIHRGSAWMSRITGSGCMLSSLLGAFLAAECSARSAWACCYMMAVCGERAEARVREAGLGTASYHIALIDELSMFSEKGADFS